MTALALAQFNLFLFVGRPPSKQPVEANTWPPTGQLGQVSRPTGDRMAGGSPGLGRKAESPTGTAGARAELSMLTASGGQARRRCRPANWAPALIAARSKVAQQWPASGREESPRAGSGVACPAGIIDVLS